MRVERINYVSECDEVVDVRGTDGVGETPPALYLDLALASYDKKTKARGRRTKLIRAHRDDGAAVSLINPDLLDEADSLLILWVRSDRKLLSASNHDLQGFGGDVMTIMVASFPDGQGGWVNIAEKFYACTTIPFAVLMGRPLMENKKYGRAGDSANGVQRFGRYTSPFMPPPAKRTPGQSVKVPV